ncbi:hypothetical protein BQ8482_370032 [Mesorhizobium delmotii]|uniref:Uncharacterized protein n=1 Tax=Mesorhizobium delmotii TaxID=1631247 RepID=A0A2P9ARM9_9HYPH|nr:hypothetical protein BQ8482_370032 [Mesorhizobium delmotii]
MQKTSPPGLPAKVKADAIRACSSNLRNRERHTQARLRRATKRTANLADWLNDINEGSAGQILAIDAIVPRRAGQIEEAVSLHKRRTQALRTY